LVARSKITHPVFIAPVKKRFFVSSTRLFQEHADLPSDPQKLRGPVSWKSLAFTLAFGGLLAYSFASAMKGKERRYQAQLHKSVGKAKIGGPFLLVDHNGKPTSSSEFRGKFLVIYFGFTHCPDICPTELKKLGNILDALEKTKFRGLIQPLFITIDPMRDSVKQIREYLKDFHGSLIGLTGTPMQIEKTSKLFRVYFSKALEDFGEHDDDDYLVDHSIILYLMDPNGEFLDFFGTNMTEEQVTARISDQMSSFLYPNGEPAWYDRVLSSLGLERARSQTAINPK